MNVFIDTNVLLDVLLQRKPFVAASQGVWFLSERGKIRGLISVLSFSNIYYIVHKLSGHATAESAMAMLRDSFSPVSFDEKILNQALDAKFKDFEDAVQYFSALHSEAVCLLTRNPVHFPSAQLPILSPADFLSTHSFE